ncbi:hypothetical protein T484DRAFT_1880187, partial [Baffinella frigidus]
CRRRAPPRLWPRSVIDWQPCSQRARPVRTWAERSRKQGPSREGHHEAPPTRRRGARRSGEHKLQPSRLPCRGTGLTRS